MVSRYIPLSGCTLGRFPTPRHASANLCDQSIVGMIKSIIHGAKRVSGAQRASGAKCSGLHKPISFALWGPFFRVPPYSEQGTRQLFMLMGRMRGCTPLH